MVLEYKVPECSLKWKSALERLSPLGLALIVRSMSNVLCLTRKKLIGVEGSAVATCKTCTNSF